MLMLFLMPLIIGEVFMLANICLSRKHKDHFPDVLVKLKRMKDFYPLLISAGLIIIFMLVQLVIHLLMAGDDKIIPNPVNFAVSVLTEAAVFARIWSDNKKIRKVMTKLGILSIALLLSEIFIFNFKSLTLSYKEEVIKGSELICSGTYTPGEDEEIPEDTVVAENNWCVETGELPDWTRAVSFSVTQGDHQRPFRIRLLLKDDNFQLDYQPVANKMTSGYGDDLVISVEPYGNIYALKAEVHEAGTPVQFHSIRVMNHAPFNFSWIRFIVLLITIGMIITVRGLKLHEITYDRTNKRHRIAAAAVTALCVLTVFAFRIPDQELVPYPDGFNVEIANPYEQAFDAIMQDQVNLAIPVEPALNDVENVYDRSVRDASGVPYAWDRVFYEGYYYSYFGLAPVIEVYFPFYIIRGKLPTMHMVCFFYAVQAVFFLCMTILTAVRCLCKKPNMLLLMMSLPAASILSGIYYSVQFPNQYDVVVASGLCFLFLTLWTGMQACLTEKKKSRIILLAVCGISTVGAAASRPSMAVGLLLLAPFFIGIILSKDMTIKFKIHQASAFLVPVLMGAAGIMWFNWYRFGSPFDFGSSYMLTVSNINANHLRLAELPASVYHYFLQPPVPKNVFPYFTFSWYHIENYQMYENIEVIIGALFYPMIACGTVMLPASLRSKYTGQASLLTTRIFIGGCFILSLLLAWMVFCIGGVSIRYMLDFMPLLTIGSILAILRTARPGSGSYRLTVIAIAATFAMLWLLMLDIMTTGNTTTTLPTEHPMLHEQLEEAFLFWE